MVGATGPYNISICYLKQRDRLTIKTTPLHAHHIASITAYKIFCTLIGGGAYKTRRLILPPQNLGPRGTLWSVPPKNFCRQMLLDPTLLY